MARYLFATYDGGDNVPALLGIADALTEPRASGRAVQIDDRDSRRVLIGVMTFFLGNRP